MEKNKSYYIEKYIELLRQAKEEAEKEGLDFGEVACEYEADANTDEVVGFYLFNEKENALRQWNDNTEYIKQPTKQDTEVTVILNGFFSIK